MYIVGAIYGRLADQGDREIDAFMIFVALSISAVVYVTYRRYVDDIKETSAKAEASRTRTRRTSRKTH